MKFLFKKKNIVVCFLLFSIFFISVNQIFATTTTDDIESTIDDLKKSIEELERQQQLYERNIAAKQREASTLNNQISILNNNINRVRVEITKKETEIRKTNLEINEINAQIDGKSIEIDDLKERLIVFLKKINRHSNKDDFKIIFLYEQLSDYFNFLKANLSVHASLQETLDWVEEIKLDLEEQEDRLQEKRKELEKLNRELGFRRDELEDNRATVTYLLNETRGAEWRFQTLLAQARAEARQIEEEVARLERELRAKLAEEEEWRRIQTGVLVFSWPVPLLRITAYFHDPRYPFRSTLGEHSGIDLRAAQGTPVRASAPGYVGRARDGGMGYSFILIIHQDGYSTLYGHISRIMVQEGQYVKRGDVVGLSGGMPGTPGAGISTGPHLHFEIRKNGIPVDPLNYLPR